VSEVFSKLDNLAIFALVLRGEPIELWRGLENIVIS
jgi:hypothetical protein